MATSPTSKSALLSGAAKDDAVGLSGDYTFTIADLLANDPGGAAKISTTTQFFFGDPAVGGGVPTIAAQTLYLASHGITANADFTEFTIGANATDITYMVQIGNKGTWSEADVTIADRPDPVLPPVPHLGDELFSEDFDHDITSSSVHVVNGVTVSSDIDLTKTDWTGTSNDGLRGPLSTNDVGVSGKLGGIVATSGDYWLDTQNTPGGIAIKNTFTDTPDAPTGDGNTAVLSFDIAKMTVNWGGTFFSTDQDASFDFLIDGHVVAHFGADASGDHNPENWADNTMQHFDVYIKDTDYDGTGEHTIELHDTTGTAGYFGFAVDSIQINDWLLV